MLLVAALPTYRLPNGKAVVPISRPPAVSGLMLWFKATPGSKLLKVKLATCKADWAVAILLPPVPPLPMGNTPVKVRLPKPSKAMLPLALTAKVPLASGSVSVRAAVAVPVRWKLLVAVPPKYKSLKALALLPKLMEVEPGKSDVFIATDAKLESAVFAPPPAPPKQLPESVQILYVPAARDGNRKVVLAVGATKLIVVVFAPVVAVKVVAPVPCRLKAWVVAPMVKAPPGVMVNVPALCSKGVVTLVEKVGLFTVVILPVADNSTLPEAETASVPPAFGTVMVLEAVKVAGWKIALKPSAVPSKKLTLPRLDVLPTLRPVVPCSARLAKVGLLALAISWIVLMVPLAAEKLVALNWAMPFWVVEASLIVTVLELPVELASVKAPVKLSNEDTPAVPPPPPLVKQVGQVRLPAASKAIGPLALMAKVPLAPGIVIVLLLAGALGLNVMVLVLVAFVNTSCPLTLPAVPRVRPLLP